MPTFPALPSLRRLALLSLCAAVLAAGSTAPGSLTMRTPDDQAAAAASKGLMPGELQRSADAGSAGDLKGHQAIYDDTVPVMTRSGPRLEGGA